MKNWVSSFVVGAVVLAAVNGHAAAKVEEKIVGPANTGGSYIVAPNGANVAYVGMKGTRLTVAVNGVEGPLFDELYGPHGNSYYCPQNVGAYRATQGGLQGGDPPVIFSTDGEHYAYAGRQGEEYVVIYDGREIARGAREALSLNYGALTITPKGRQVYWDEWNRGPARSTWRLMMSGRPGPWSGHQTMTPVFSPDESRYAYNAGKVDDYQQQMLVVDGKVADYVGVKPVFTADNKLLLSVSQATVANPKTALLANGKPVVTGTEVLKIIPGPVGNHYAAIVSTRLENFKAVKTLFMDGREVPGTDGVQTVWFSPDGKHWAAACSNEAARSLFMVVDGKRHREYQGVSTENVYWTPDGSRFFYTVTSGGRPFLVVNEEEFPITSLVGSNPIAMPEKGNRYGFATRDGSNRNFTVFIDGKSVLPSGIYPYDAPTFSPDGSRYGYFFGPVGRNELTGFVLDGVSRTDVPPAYFSRWMPGDLTRQAFVFSPDGKHVAYLGSGKGLYVDDKFVYPTGRPVFYPTFTQDSRHLIWVAVEPAKVRGQNPLVVVYVDGQPAVSADGYFFRDTQLGSMDGNGVVSFLAADGDMVKRYRITASSETSVAKMVTDAETNRAKAVEETKADAQKAAEEEAAAKAKAEADAAAAAIKAKADAEAAAAKRKADYEAAVAAKLKARQEAYEAKKNARLLQLENAKRAKQGLPPLKELN